MVTPKQGKRFTVNFKDGSVSTVQAKTSDEAILIAQLILINAPVPADEEPATGIPIVESVTEES